MLRYWVGPHQNGVRLDHFVHDQLRKRSRKSIQDAIQNGNILIERDKTYLPLGKIKAATPVFFGDSILVRSLRKPEPDVSFAYQILHEDDAILIVNKPPMLPVHPSGRYYFNTLLIHLKTQGHTIKEVEAQKEYFLPHRIDKETSGLMVMTKSSATCAKIVAQFAQRKTTKAYFAIVYGHTPPAFRCDAPLARSPHAKIKLKMAVTPLEAGGLPSLTEFTTVEHFSREGHDFSLVKCFPKTGRQHQIRAHLFALGFPIVGDKLYGVAEEFALLFFERERLTAEAEAKLLWPHHLLHSCHLGFRHPLTGEPVEFNTDIPPDFNAFIRKTS